MNLAFTKAATKGQLLSGLRNGSLALKGGHQNLHFLLVPSGGVNRDRVGYRVLFGGVGVNLQVPTINQLGPLLSGALVSGDSRAVSGLNFLTSFEAITATRALAAARCLEPAEAT